MAEIGTTSTGPGAGPSSDPTGVHFAPPTRRCGRTTQGRGACRAWTVGSWPGPHGPACATHMTAAERAEMEATRAPVVAEPPPACWDWPVTADDLAAAAGEGAAPGILADWQRGRCAACGYSTLRIGVGREMDHDHDTGLLRGWLCVTCNRTEPGAEDGSTLARYRKRNPATMLGVRARYLDPVRGWAEPSPPPMPLDRDPSYAIWAARARRRSG